MPNPELSILLVNYNTHHLLAEVFASLRQASLDLQTQIIMLDNASTDDSKYWLRAHGNEMTLIFNASNVGFGRANNQCLQLATGRYVLPLNTDAFVAADSLRKTMAYMDAHPRCGVLGVKLVGRDGTLQPSCRYFPTPWNLFLTRSGFTRFFKRVRLVDDMDWDHASPRQCDWVPGCYYLIRREVIEQVGLFDPRYFLYYEEIDHCFAAKKAGWEVHYFHDTTVVHIGGESAKSEGAITASGRQIEAFQIESELLYFRKNHGLVSVWLDVVLTTLADVILFKKRVLRWQRPFEFGTYAKHAALMWQSLIDTHWGTRPTR